ncbi:hypothetical protein [Mesonia aestuariivivens]|uniref:Uncharacterized protein n=1 Tax=Mesonia aestuariivivens TaxID=2796128 RepID=A0ABS6W2C3_9FLAO|nr:hypothetical protein [Mesonia aestuariivivens]MBW2961697.1 hypothetical protein [Mesonia aestuariivivens]
MEEHFYYLNREPYGDGVRYIHTFKCKLKPQPLFLVKLGFFKDPRRALVEGLHYFSNIGLCKECCKINDKVLTHEYLYRRNKSQEIL